MEDISTASRPTPWRWPQFVNSLGDGAYYVTSALFLTTVVGLSPAHVGVGLGCAWLLGFLAATPVGSAADRFGHREAAVTLAVVTAAALSMLATARSLAAFVVAATLYAVAQSGSGAVRQALLVTLVPADARVGVRARLQATANAGLGLGAAVGGVALAAGTPSAYIAVLLADAVTFLVAAWLLRRLPASAPGTRTRHGSWLAVLRDHRYVAAAWLVLGLLFPTAALAVGRVARWPLREGVHMAGQPAG